MRRLHLFVIIVTLIAPIISCNQSQQANEVKMENLALYPDTLSSVRPADRVGDGALLLSAFHSYDELRDVLRISYKKATTGSAFSLPAPAQVSLTYHAGGREIKSVLKAGISQTDFKKALEGKVIDRILLAIRSPFAVLHKHDLMSIESLGRRRPFIYGNGDVAFYDLAEKMVSNISDEDLTTMPAEYLSEKGYLNTFNHITAQAFMTSVFAGSVADFVADVHERYNLPEMITGNFTKDQMADLYEGPLDNYIDMINNEYGQELGKSLRLKYHINRKTFWTPGLLADFLNDVQNYHSWAFQIAFKPFRPSDEIVVRFAQKINIVMKR